MRKNLAFIVAGEDLIIRDIINNLHIMKDKGEIRIIHYKVGGDKRFRIESHKDKMEKKL